MAIKDIASGLQPQLVFRAVISTDTDTFTSSVDMANFDGGYMFTFFSTIFTDGIYVLTLQDSPDDSNWTDVSPEKINGASNDKIFVSSVSTAGDVLQKIGAFSTNRFLRAKITSTSTSTGATLMVIATKMAELSPIDV